MKVSINQPTFMSKLFFFFRFFNWIAKQIIRRWLGIIQKRNSERKVVRKANEICLTFHSYSYVGR